jgi:hypothetical protein
MARNVIYELPWVNRAGWNVFLTIIPADLHTNSLAAADVVTIPRRCIQIGSFSTLKASFENGVPVGMVDTQSLEFMVILSRLEDAAEEGYADGTDLNDLVDYLLYPTYANGGTMRIGANEGRDYDTRNFIRLEFSGGPFAARFTAFEGIQEQLSEDDMFLTDTGTWKINIKVRNFWRVALETITGADVHAQFTHASTAIDRVLTCRDSYDIATIESGFNFIRMTRFESPYVHKEAGTTTRLYEYTDYYAVRDLWGALEGLVTAMYDDHTRGANHSSVPAFSSHENVSAVGIPFDMVTPAKQTYGLAGTKGDDITETVSGNTRPNWGAVLFPALTVFRDPFAVEDEEVESGGFISSHASFGMSKLKTAYDFVKQAAEQSLAKVVPMHFSTSDYRLYSLPVFDTIHDSGTYRSPTPLTIIKRDIKGTKKKVVDENTAGDRKITLRSGLIGEAEAGMQEGQGDDVKTVEVQGYGHEQADGFNLPLAMHNLPRLGDKAKDRDFWTSGDFGLDPDGGNTVFYDGPTWESGLYYAEETEDFGGFFNEDFGNLPAPVRIHENLTFYLGNGYTETDSVTVPRSDEADFDLFREDMRNLVYQIQTTTGWGFFAAYLYTKYFSNPLQSTISIDVPGHHALPEYVGEWFDLADNAGVSKGLEIYRTSPRLAAFPKKFCLVSTELDFALNGRAIVNLWASPYAEPEE